MARAHRRLVEPARHRAAQDAGLPCRLVALAGDHQHATLARRRGAVNERREPRVRLVLREPVEIDAALDGELAARQALGRALVDAGAGGGRERGQGRLGRKRGLDRRRAARPGGGVGRGGCGLRRERRPDRRPAARAQWLDPGGDLVPQRRVAFAGRQGFGGPPCLAGFRLAPLGHDPFLGPRQLVGWASTRSAAGSGSRI